MTDLEQFITDTPIMNTHEHMCKEKEWVDEPWDILEHLFNNYMHADLCVAGATDAQMEALFDRSEPDIAGRFAPIREAWDKCRLTGYGEGTRAIAKIAYGIDTITAESLAAAQEQHPNLHQPGERLRVLNQGKRHKLSVKVTDLHDEENNAVGTEVEILIPLF